MTDFEKLKIKEYKYWEVFVAENQSYLGRCVVWCKRDDAEDATDATQDEWDELLEVLRELRVAVKEAFKADWFNYSFLGNATRHFHGHFVPRYETEREFEGTTFKDWNWGSNFSTDRDFVTPDKVREKIRQKIAEALG